ncbi:MAG: very short patch repair endonuclease [Candidatus Kerfeldbacteria bacterium]|nr:very short patch repair endonuclease [Candidatus Kerfeldbacteria bacterium]
MVDNLTPEQRSFTMSRIRSRDTKPELAIRRLMHARGLRFRTHKNGLLGRPDLVFARAKVVVFVDGDFWHGWRFPCWEHKLGPYWKKKIEGNRRRDQRTFRRLRAAGWFVIRIWEHDVERDAAFCGDRIEEVLKKRLDGRLNRQR